jgi:transposase
MSGGMLIPPGPIRVLVATKPVDFRKGMDGLAALVKEHLNADPFSGVIFCFRAKRADRVKLILWDGTGLCLFAKRLEGGKFRWPRIEDGVMRGQDHPLRAKALERPDPLPRRWPHRTRHQHRRAFDAPTSSDAQECSLRRS